MVPILDRNRLEAKIPGISSISQGFRELSELQLYVVGVRFYRIKEASYALSGAFFVPIELLDRHLVFWGGPALHPFCLSKVASG